MTLALRVFQSDELSGASGELSGADVEQIIIRLDQLSSEVSDLRAAMESYIAASDAKTGFFWAQTWPSQAKQSADHEARIRVLERKVWAAAGAAAVLGAFGSKVISRLGL